MQYLIINDENTVIVDGEKRSFDFELDSNIEAVRWDDNRERAKGRIKNKVGLDDTFDDLTEYQNILDQHAAILAQEAEDKAAADLKFKLAQNVAKREIEDLEAKITPRRMREAVLTEQGKAWLVDIESQIKTLREEL